MDKQKKLQIALPLLILVMAFVWGPVIMGDSPKKQKGKSVGRAISSAVSNISNADLIALIRSSERKKAKTSYEEWGRNPFMLSAGPKASVLEGIMWDPQSPQAIINGYILGVGDKVGAGEVIDIQQTSVTIKTGATEKVYSLGQ